MIKVGLCGWTISQREYFERFPVVEVQQTFYHPPPLYTVRRWRSMAPPGFEFTLKAWQLITHEATSRTYRRFRGTLSETERREVGSFRWSDPVRSACETTLECARILRASSVLFQCPASFRPTDQNLERMRVFFRSAPREGFRFLWEPRGPSWPSELVATLHGITGARHVYTDDELRRLAAMLPPHGEAYVMFNNIPRDGDSERFMRLIGA